MVTSEARDTQGVSNMLGRLGSRKVSKGQCFRCELGAIPVRKWLAHFKKGLRGRELKQGTLNQMARGMRMAPWGT